MISFPNAKINLGLHITQKRSDGFHNLQTLFYPIGLSDILEIQENKQNQGTSFTNSGLRVDTTADKNLCMAAFNKLKSHYKIPDVRIHLHKDIPFGAGLGGGSSDAATTLFMLNKIFDLAIPENELIEIAGELGADCPFFLKNRPCFATGKGNLLEPVSLTLKDYHLVLVVPQVKISTKFAYQGIRPAKKDYSLKEKALNLPIQDWKKYVTNDFENHIFHEYPDLKNIKNRLYEQGALYASLSGSGSSIFGIYDKMPEIKDSFQNALVWEETL